MRRALYDPEHGYYRQARDPFGKDGDFFTASQVQPLFGNIIAAEANALAPGQPVFELGPGRREMASYFNSPYKGIEWGEPLPSDLSGFVFANEFFDALPVRVGTQRDGILYELFVATEASGARWELGPQLDADSAAYVQRYWPQVHDGGCFEIGREAWQWMDRIASRMCTGNVLIVDYGFTTAETIRFPQGTLMSYRDHAAIPAVLQNPGLQDITAHVAFDALRDRAEAQGFCCERLETLAQLVIRNVERSPCLAESFQARQQLKTLLFGLGETFRCLSLSRMPAKKERPRSLGAQ